MDAKKARAAAEQYCENSGLSVMKLKDLYQQIISNSLYYAKFPDVNPNGLKNDLATRAVPVLKVTNQYAVEETEYTREVLL